MNAPDPRRSRGRRQLVLVVLVFAVPIVAATVLAWSDWRPRASKNHGVLLDTPQDFRAVVAIDARGEAVVWNSADGLWHMVVRAPDDCGAPCVRMSDSLARVWTGLAGDAMHARVVWAGKADPQTAAVLAQIPHARIVAMETSLLPPPSAPRTGDELAPLGVWLVDPNGYLVLRYDAGFDPTGLRADLRRLIR
jgi:cytochrome oxidase Cu insertion factor (SCO1/SenC/PrrC family)